MEIFVTGRFFGAAESGKQFYIFMSRQHGNWFRFGIPTEVLAEVGAKPNTRSNAVRKGGRI